MGLMFNSEEHIALAKALRVRSYAAIGLIECCIHLAAVEAPRGNIGKLANDSIALGVDWAGNPDLLVEGLLSSGFFSAHLEFRLVIKRWNEIAPDECQRALAFKHTDLWDGTKPVFNQHLRISGSTCRERRRARILLAGGEPSRKLRRRILDRDGRKCRLCGSAFDLTLDHVTPVSLSGKTVEANLQTLCRPCNSRKGNRT